MDDLIKRSDAIEAITFSMLNALNTEERISLIMSLPSADRPQGKWIRNRYWSRGVGMGEEYGFFYKCSLCEYEVEDGYTRCNFNYCPHCGARMFAKDINVPNKKGAEE